MSDVFRILTVCQGNVHRSALAASLLQTWAGWYLPSDVASRVRVGSAGLGAPEGAPMQGAVLQIAAALGADGSDHRARRISDDLIGDADLVLTASRRQRDDVVQRVPAALRTTFTVREAGRIAALLDVTGDPGIARMQAVVSDLALHRSAPADSSDDDIADPQGRDDDAFREMARTEVPALARLAVLLFGMPRADYAEYLTAVQQRDLLEGAP
jgi:protein-tyrosine phosphatase